MGAIQDSVQIWQQLESDKIHVLMHRCVRVRNRNTRCQNCVDFCPTGCISLEGNNISVDPFSCIGCGTCSTACPTGALVSLKPGDAQLEDECAHVLDANDGKAVIVCREIMNKAAGRVDPAKVVGVECLSRVDESLLVDLAGLGAEAAYLVCGDCSACELNKAGQMALEVVLTTRDLLGAWKSPMALEVHQKLPGFVRLRAEHDEGRRGAVRDVRDMAVDVAAAAADYEIKQALGSDHEERFSYAMLRSQNGRNLPQFMPKRRQLLHEALDYLGEPEDDILTTRLWGHAELDGSACDGCGLCEMFCPSGAIRMVYPGEEESGPVFDGQVRGAMDRANYVDVFPKQCLQCRTCEDICPKKAIRIDQQVFASDIASGVGERFTVGAEYRRVLARQQTQEREAQDRAEGAAADGGKRDAADNVQATGSADRAGTEQSVANGERGGSD